MKKVIKIFILVNVLLSVVCYNLIDIENAFEVSESFVMFDKKGRLLGAQIAKDDQWRFPLIDSIPEKYKVALIAFEDKRFYQHVGVDPRSIIRAFKSNMKARKVVSGASTLTMQLMRLSRGKRPRNVKQKIIESYLAVLYSLKYDKETILKYYASHAPFGGNVIGLETAAWRYFGRQVSDLSWAEAATLAVLPNSPALIHPSKNRNSLKQKRDKLLKSLYEFQSIDSMEYVLAIEEKLPEAPKDLPSLAGHYLQRCKAENNGVFKKSSSIDFQIQKNVLEILKMHEAYNASKGINNASVIIMENQTGNILSYVGNTNGDRESKFNDMVMTPRSTGSILKPLLYACSMEDGLVSPKQLLSDVPIQLDGFQPKNYDKNFMGLVPANEALSKSLNIPFVLMLREYGTSRFISRLHDFGFSTINKNADHYGLSLILGGGEVRLDELTSCYSSLAKQLVNQDHKILNPATIYHMFDAMTELKRPNNEIYWERFSSSIKIAWKTGTSYGNRDAWAIGVCPEYTIGVWVGNSDGESNSEIIGSTLAGPLLFDIVYSLDGISEFKAPSHDLLNVQTCKRSGFKAGLACLDREYQSWSPSLSETRLCPFHKTVFIDSSRNYLVNRDCIENIIDTSWFVVPPKEAYFLRKYDPSYSPLPGHHPLCKQVGDNKFVDIIYPQEKSSFAIPNNLKQEKERIVCQVAHQNMDAKIYWHLDNEYVGMTEEFHKISIESGIGVHRLYVIDDQGRYDETFFEIIK